MGKGLRWMVEKSTDTWRAERIPSDSLAGFAKIFSRFPKIGAIRGVVGELGSF
jgi:hypothetical protein